MNNDKLLELAAMLQTAIDQLNDMAKPKPAPYQPKKGDRVEVLAPNGGGLGKIGERGTVMEDSRIPWVRLDNYDYGYEEAERLGIEKGHGVVFDQQNIRPLTPEEIAAEEEAKRPKVGDWVRHADGSTGYVIGSPPAFCTIRVMGRCFQGVPKYSLTVIPKP